MRVIEERAELLKVSGLLLMENAGKSIADYLKNKFGDPENKRVVVVSGLGNNSGDGSIAARHLAGYGASVEIFLLGKRVKRTNLPTTQQERVIETGHQNAHQSLYSTHSDMTVFHLDNQENESKG